MIRNSLFSALAIIASLVAGSAHARFGKGGGGGSSSSSSSSSSSHSSSSHASAPIGSVPRSSSSGGSYYSGSGYNGGSSYYGSAYSPWRYGYYSGAFVPMYGYGYGYYGMNPYGYGSPAYASPYSVSNSVRQEPSSLRVTLGVEATPYIGQERGGFGLSGLAMFEGERWGVSLAFQHIAAPSGTSALEFDTIQQFNAHGTFAFLTGKYGRLRVELGGDSIFASNLIVLAPTGGFSGTLWLSGPVALEASVMITPWPIRQLDLRGGVVVGFGPLGLRAGWRTQVLDDQGLVDGVVNRDTFMGPYAGVSLAF